MQVATPSERDLSIYRAIRLDGVFASQVVDAMKITLEEVDEIVSRVDAWYALTANDWAKTAMTPLAACRIYHERLDYLYREAMDSWRASKMLPTGTAKHPAPATHGNPRFLAIAMKIASAQVDAAVQLAKILEKQSSPPAGGCAPQATQPAPEQHATAKAHVVKAETEEVYGDAFDADAAAFAAESDFQTPVQSAAVTAKAARESVASEPAQTSLR